MILSLLFYVYLHGCIILFWVFDVCTLCTNISLNKYKYIVTFSYILVIYLTIPTYYYYYWLFIISSDCLLVKYFSAKPVCKLGKLPNSKVTEWVTVVFVNLVF